MKDTITALAQRFGAFGTWLGAVLLLAQEAVAEFAVEGGRGWAAVAEADSALLATAVVALGAPLLPLYRRFWPGGLAAPEARDGGAPAQGPAPSVPEPSGAPGQGRAQEGGEAASQDPQGPGRAGEP